MHKTIEQEIQQLLANLNGQNEGEEAEEQTPGQNETEIQDMYVLVVRERDTEAEEPHETVVAESTLTPTPTKTETSEPIDPLMYATGSFFLFLVLSCIFFQMYLALNPPIATITIVPKSQTVTLTGTLQLGRVLPPLTLSQSQTVPTTGTDHQIALFATGYITFYNGQLNSVSIPAGTIFTASNGVQVITEHDALIPAASPPLEGQATLTAHAVTTGTQGNIPAKSIHTACCALSVLAVNLTSFRGGQDERNFQTVSKADIARVATPLKTAVAQSMSGALQGQVHPNEQLALLPCRPTVTSDHPIGAQATQVTITVSETCSAVAYTKEAVERKATDLLTRQAVQKLGIGYSLIGTVQVAITQATVTPTTATLIFSCQGTWVYTVSQEAQQQMKHRIAGKPRQEAITLLLAMPGIATATIEGDDQTKLPKSLDALHLSIIVPTGSQ